MKISNRRIVNDIQSLRAISQKQLPVKVSYAISKNISHIESELKIYNKERAKLVDKYAAKDKKGNIKSNNGMILFKDQDAWDKDINTLLDIENDIDIHKFKLSELNGFNISPAELQAIDYMYMIEE